MTLGADIDMFLIELVAEVVPMFDANWSVVAAVEDVGSSERVVCKTPTLLGEHVWTPHRQEALDRHKRQKQDVE